MTDINSSPLGPGAIAFIGYNSSDGVGGDAFGFVALCDIPAGQTISFTDTGALASGALSTAENTVVWTSPGITAGTVVQITDRGSSASTGTVTGDTLNLSTGGDQILAYTGTSAAPTFLAAIDMGGGFTASVTTSTTSVPAGLTEGTDAVSIVPEVNNASYTGPTVFADQAQALSVINDPANWTTQDSAFIDPATWAASIALDPAQVPAIRVTGGDPAAAITDGDTTPDTVDGTDFGTLMAGDRVVRTFTIHNDGAGDLIISGATLQGLDTSDFSIAGFTNGTIPSGGSQNIVVTLDPVAEGAADATLVISSNDPAAASFDFAVTGVSDETAPDLTDTTPDDSATAVATDAPIVLTFSEDVFAGTGDIVVQNATGAVIETFDVTSDPGVVFNGNTITITPSAPLPEAATIEVIVDAGAVVDVAGNPFTPSAEEVTFTTEAGLPTALIIVSGQSLGSRLFDEDESGIDGFTTTLTLAQLQSLSGHEVADRLASGDMTAVDNGNGTVTLNNITAADRLAIEYFETLQGEYSDVVLVSAASGGKPMLAQSNPAQPSFFDESLAGAENAVGDGNGDFDGELLSGFVKGRIDDAVEGQSNLEFIGLIWTQGEADTGLLGSNPDGSAADEEAEALYAAGLDYTLNEIINYTLNSNPAAFANQTTEPTAYIQHIGRRTNYSSGLDDVKTIQQELAESSDNIVIASETYDLALGDPVHPTADSFHTAASRLAGFIAGEDAGPQAGDITIENTATNAIITIDLILPSGFDENDIVLGADAKDLLFVTDEGVLSTAIDDADGERFIPVDSVVIAGSSLVFTLSRPLEGDGTITYGYGGGISTDGLTTLGDQDTVVEPVFLENGDRDQPLYAFTHDFIDIDYLPPDTVAPTLVSSIPSDDSAFGVADADIVLTFDERVVLGTGEIKLIRESDGAEIAVTATADDTRIILDPLTDLDIGETYSVSVAADAIEDRSGNAFAGITDPTTLNFTVSEFGGAVALGDIAFIGYGADDVLVTDGFAIVAVRDILPGSTITFTDRGWDGASLTTEGNDDGTFTWTSPGVAAGTVITFEREGSTHVASVGETDGGRLNLSTGGDQILAFTGEATNPDFVAAINMNGAFGLESEEAVGSLLPTGLTEGFTALAIDPELDNAYYIGPTDFVTQEAALLAFNDPANWIGSNTDIDQAAWQTDLYTIGGPDVEAPTLLSTSPADDETAVAANSAITLQFSEAVVAGVGEVRLISSLGDVEVPSTVSIDGDTVTITPDAPLTPGQEFYVDIAPDALVDVAGNPFAGITDATALNFFTFNALALEPGAIAFIGYNSDDVIGAGDGTDAFGFVSLVNIPAGQQISFTENGVFSGSLGVGESTLVWTSPGITAGTVVTIERTAFGPEASLGTVDGDAINFSNNGDQIIAYQGDASDPTFLAALDMSGGFGAEPNTSFGTELPPGLIDGQTALAVTPEVDNAYYDGPTNFIDQSEALATINNPANWASQDDPLVPLSSWISGVSGVAAAPGPEISVLGGTAETGFERLTDGDITPDLADGTDFGVTGTAVVTERTFSIRNDGGGPLSVTDVSVSGVDADAFTVVDFTPATVAPGASLTFTVEFDPATAGEKNATLQILSDDADEALFDVAIRGTVDIVGPTLVSTLPADDAADVALGSSLELTFDEPVAAGTGVITIRRSADDSIYQSIDVTDPSVTFDGNTVTIQPDTLFFQTEFYVEIADGVITDAFGNAFAGITDPTAFSFTTGDIPSGPIFTESFETDGEGTRYVSSNTVPSTSADYFTRTDGSDISIKDPEGYQGADGSFFYAGEDLDGLSPSDVETLTFNQIDTSGRGELTVTGSFAAGNPFGAGASAYDDRDYVALLYSTDGGQTYQIGLLFRSVPNGNDLANEPLGLVEDLSLLVDEAAAADELRDADGDGDADVRGVLSGTGSSSQILTNDFQDFSFTVPESDSLDIIVVSHMDGGNEEFAFDNIRVTGEGVTFPVPEIDVIGADGVTSIADGDTTPDLTDGTDFGATGLGAGSQRTYTIRNDGTAALNLAAVSITGVDADDFEVTGFAPGALGAGETLDITITFTPEATGTSTATVEITSDDFDEAVYDFTIQGRGDVTAPVLLGSSPADDAVDAPNTGDITLTFDEAVVATTGSVQIVNSTTGIPVASFDVTGPNVTVDGATVTVSPTAPLDLGTGYHVTIDAGAFEDTAGNAFGGITDPATLNFTTAALPPGPLFTETFETDGLGTRYTVSATYSDGDDDYFTRTDGSDIDPKNSAGYLGQEGQFFWAGEDLDGITPSDVETMTFNQISTSGSGEMTFTGSFAVGNTNGTGASSYDTNDYLAVLYSTDGGTTYEIGLLFRSIENGGDSANEPFGLVESLGLTTSEAAAADVLRDADGNGDADIRGVVSGFGSSSQRLTNEFQEFSFTIEAADTVDIIIASHMDGGNEEFAFDDLELTGGGAPVVDTTPPILAGTTPGDNAVDVSIGANITLTFNEPVQAVGGFISLHTGAGVVETIDVTSGRVSVNGSTVTVDPVTVLDFNTTYFVTIDDGAFTDTAGNAFGGIADTTSFDFTTEATDIVAPSLTSTSPSDEASSVAVGADITLNFDEPVLAGVGVVIIRDASDNSVVESITVPSGQVVISGPSVTVNPTADLAPSGDFFVEVSNGAFTDGAGNAFVGFTGPDVLSFSTAADGTPSDPPVNSSGLPSAPSPDPSQAINGLVGSDNADDHIIGTSSGEKLDGKGGNDVVFGEGGNDTLRGRDGNDILIGGDGIDTIEGDGGDDQLFGQDGNDKLRGRDGNDILLGGAGNDVLRGDAGDDIIGFGEGLDVVEGGANSDSFVFTGGGSGSQIKDFNVSEGDVLDLSGVITGSGVASDFIRITGSSSTKTVEINTDGVGDDFQVSFTFQGDATDESLTALVDGGFLIF